LPGDGLADATWWGQAVEIDTNKIDEAVLALLYLTLHDGVRAWKGHDWDAVNRLDRKGMIYDGWAKRSLSCSPTRVWRRASGCSERYSRNSRHWIGEGLGCSDNQAAAANDGWKFQGRSSSR